MMPFRAPRSCGAGSPLERRTMTRYFGAHTIDTGGIDMAVRRAAGAGATALQIFTAIPKYYGDKSSIRPERVARFRAALAAAGIRRRSVIVHAAYVLNTATTDEIKWGRAAARARQGARALDGARRRRRRPHAGQNEHRLVRRRPRQEPVRDQRTGGPEQRAEEQGRAEHAAAETAADRNRRADQLGEDQPDQQPQLVAGRAGGDRMQDAAAAAAEDLRESDGEDAEQ